MGLFDAGILTGTLRKIHIMENTASSLSMPRIGGIAPDFEVMTSVGKLKFSDYNKCSWVIFFSRPADFTPVCTTELSAFAEEEPRFNSMNCKLLGLSIDSIHSYIAWIQNVKKNLRVKMKFPLIADIDMKVSKLYGMLQPGESETAAVRAVFFIDPSGNIRLIMYYPLNVGRNMEEIIRLLKALQVSDEHKVDMHLN